MPLHSSRTKRDRDLGISEIHDARALRALTHPVRLALLRALSEEGSLPATQAGRIIDESTTTCSFHLRQLAKYGFIEEGPRGPGRTRPWRLTHRGTRYSSTGQTDPDMEVAAGALARLARDEQLARLESWTRRRHTAPPEWRDGAVSVQMNLYLTAEEMAGLEGDTLGMFLPRFRERIEDPSRRPTGSQPVEALFFAYPTRLDGVDPGDPVGTR